VVPKSIPMAGAMFDRVLDMWGDVGCDSVVLYAVELGRS